MHFLRHSSGREGTDSGSKVAGSDGVCDVTRDRARRRKKTSPEKDSGPTRNGNAVMITATTTNVLGNDDL